MAADPKTSAGARTERTAFRDYLRRRLRAMPNDPSLQASLEWVEHRRKRYDKKAGGLGRK